MELISLDKILTDDLREIINTIIQKKAQDETYKIVLGYAKIGNGQSILHPGISINFIIQTVCDFYEVGKDDILSKGRKQPFMKYRQLVQYFADQSKEFSLTYIGEKTGGFHHSTIINSRRSIQNYIETDRKFAIEIEKIRTLINEV